MAASVNTDTCFCTSPGEAAGNGKDQFSMWSDLGVNSCNADPGGGSEEGGGACSAPASAVFPASSTASSSSSLTFSSCWGFSSFSRQSAAVIPFFSRSALRCEALNDHLLVYCLGSWCIVRGPAVNTEGEATRGALIPATGCLQQQQQRRRGLSAAGEHAKETNKTRENDTQSSVPPLLPPVQLDPPPMGPSSPSRLYSERIYSAHCNKVNLLVYSQALNLCLSGKLEQK